MYIVVRYGEKEEGIFNPNCKCITLLNNIRDRCIDGPDDGDDNGQEIELSDETGGVKNLREFPFKYANEILTDREKLVLLRVDRKDNGDSMFTPLLQDKDFVTDQFISQLTKNTLGAGGSRRNRTSSSRRRQKEDKNSSKQAPADNKSNKNSLTPTNKGGRTSSIGRSKSRVGK